MRQLVVADVQGSVFRKVSSLGLGIAVWRIVRSADELEVDGGTLLLIAAYEEPDWTAIGESAARCPTIVVASPTNADDALTAIRLGAFGYVDGAMDEEKLRRTLTGVLCGETGYSRLVLGTWLRKSLSIERSTFGAPEGLTPRQRQIIELIASGSTDRQIGVALGIRTATAQKHVANVLRRLKVRNRAAIVGLLVTGDPRLTAPDTRPR